jgi:dephospho-CoA kinase
MMIVGLTGSIGMGKTETARMFAEAGIPVFGADAEVHNLQAKGGRALPLIAAEFPSVITGGVLDRAALGKIVFADDKARKTLEAIMHPMVAEARTGFFKAAEKSGAPFVILDIPLLFETAGDKACHKVVVVSAPAEVQRARVLARPGMTAEKFTQILAKQTPDADKREKADYIIETDKGLAHAKARVTALIEQLKETANRA